MNRTEIYWLGLHNDREREIYVDAFWEGVAATSSLQRSVIDIESKWRVEQSIRGTKAEVDRCNAMARRFEQNKRGNTEMVSPV